MNETPRKLVSIYIYSRTKTALLYLDAYISLIFRFQYYNRHRNPPHESFCKNIPLYF